MPNTESAKRALRKAERRRLRNRSQRSALRTWEKKVRKAVAAGDQATAAQYLQVAIKRLDQAADKHLIHPNNAARRKSRLTILVNKLKLNVGAAAPSSK
ncbi:MAG: 30S ribosomal protein S20 [Planctomycetaceae bacterium]|nr:MAG: 30S ribosomal protein S20 [Planctomycetaceae bacterium]